MYFVKFTHKLTSWHIMVVKCLVRNYWLSTNFIELHSTSPLGRMKAQLDPGLVNIMHNYFCLNWNLAQINNMKSIELNITGHRVAARLNAGWKVLETAHLLITYFKNTNPLFIIKSSLALYVMLNTIFYLFEK